MPITLLPNGTVELTSDKLATGVHLLDEAGATLTIGGAGGTSSTDSGAFTAGGSSGTPAMGYVGTDAVAGGQVGVVGMLGNRQVKVTLYDSAGAELAVGGGTQYTEDAAAAANPVGNALIMVRADALAGVTTTDGDNVAVRGTNKGELYVKHADSVAVTGTFFQATQPVSGTVAVTHDALTELAAAINASSQMDVNVAAGTVAVTHAALTELGTAIDTEVQCDIVGALPAGTNAIGKLAANSGVDIGDVDVTSISAGTNTIGNVGLIGRTTGGLSMFRSIDIDESEEEIKGSAGQVFSIVAFNRTATPLYLKFYNDTAANVIVGTTTPVLTFLIPANADSDGAGFSYSNPIGLAFSAAITVACTTGVLDNDTGAPGANDAIVNVGYA